MIPPGKGHFTDDIDRHPANRARVAPQGPLAHTRPDHGGRGDGIENELLRQGGSGQQSQQEQCPKRCRDHPKPRPLPCQGPKAAQVLRRERAEKISVKMHIFAHNLLRHSLATKRVLRTYAERY